MISIPLRTVSGMNAREHWSARARRVRAERASVALFVGRAELPAPPCTVRITRVAPSNGLDDDNLASALKGARDEIATWLGVDDKRRDLVRYVYSQRRGPWAVEIEFGELQADQEFRRLGREMKDKT